MSESLGTAFHQSVQEGEFRLGRTWPSLLATGTVGGIDVSIGVLATLLVATHSGNELLAALAFSIGFIALTLANSELFTENFLIPIAAVAAGRATVRSVFRLWTGTAATNLLGGAAMAIIMVAAFPDIATTAVEKGAAYIDRGFGWEAWASSVLAGIVITLLTWTQHGTSSDGARLVAAVAAAFVLAYGHLSHVVVASIEVFTGILAGAPYGLRDWIPKFFLWAAGNAVGGIGLVTLLRLVQVGADGVVAERPAAEEEEGVLARPRTGSPVA